MKLWTGVAMTAMLVFASGCEMQEQTVAEQNSEVDAWLVESMQDTQIENAIIRQHTVYPYHFVVNSAELNELGGRDLDVLARHYKEHPGQINIRRGDIGEDLWQARCKTIVKQLADSGVDMNLVSIDEGLAGGDGMTAPEVILRFRKYAIEVDNDSQTTYQSTNDLSTTNN